MDVGVGYHVGDGLGVGDGVGYDVGSGVVGAGGGIIIPLFYSLFLFTKYISYIITLSSLSSFSLYILIHFYISNKHKIYIITNHVDARWLLRGLGTHGLPFYFSFLFIHFFCIFLYMLDFV